MQQKLAQVIQELAGGDEGPGPDRDYEPQSPNMNGGGMNAGGYGEQGMDEGYRTAYGNGGGQSAWGGAGGATPYGVTPYGQGNGWGA
jgi:DNA-directed RNA polymerase II subunit RPB3